MLRAMSTLLPRRPPTTQPRYRYPCPQARPRRTISRELFPHHNEYHKLSTRVPVAQQHDAVPWVAHSSRRASAPSGRWPGAFKVTMK